MTIAPYKYTISQDLDHCAKIVFDDGETAEFDNLLYFLFEQNKIHFEKQTGKLINNISLEYVDSNNPFASIQNCMGEYTIYFSKGFKNLIYAFSYLCTLGYNMNCHLFGNDQDDEVWAVYANNIQLMNELFESFFVKKTFNFNLLSAFEKLNVCLKHDLFEISAHAHDIFEGIIKFILAHEISHVLEEIYHSKVKEEEKADRLAWYTLVDYSNFKLNDSESKEQIKLFLNSDFYSAFKSSTFAFLMLMIIDIKQDEMDVYKPCCGFNHDEHPSAEHRFNQFMLSKQYFEIPTSKMFLKWRSSLVYFFAFKTGVINDENMVEFKKLFSKI